MTEIVDKKTGLIRKISKKWFPKIDENGKEKLNPVPLFVELGLTHEDPIDERLKRILRSERLREEIKSRGHETYEDAFDFDIEEDEPLSEAELAAQAYNIKVQQMSEERPLEPSEPTPAPTPKEDAEKSTDDLN